MRNREHVLDEFVKKYSLLNGAELGVWRGRVYKFLLSRNPNLTLLGVDLYEPQIHNNGPEKWIKGESGHDWDHESYYRDIIKFKESIGDRAKFIRDYTHKACLKVEDESLDFVFIDADHSFNSVNRDIKDWLPKLKSNGFIFGHDINWPSVKKAVELNFGQNYLKENDNLWYVQLK